MLPTHLTYQGHVKAALARQPPREKLPKYLTYLQRQCKGCLFQVVPKADQRLPTHLTQKGYMEAALPGQLPKQPLPKNVLVSCQTQLKKYWEVIVYAEQLKITLRVKDTVMTDDRSQVELAMILGLPRRRHLSTAIPVPHESKRVNNVIFVCSLLLLLCRGSTALIPSPKRWLPWLRVHGILYFVACCCRQ